MSLAKLQQYLQITTNSNIEKITEYLKPLGLTYVLYVKEFKSGERCYITNNKDWSFYYYQNQLYTQTDFEIDENYPEGNYLWHSLHCKQVYQLAENLFDVAHGITLVRDRAYGKDYWHFATSAKNYGVYNLYTNKIELLNGISQFILEKAAPEIKLAEKNLDLLPILTNKINITKPQIAYDSFKLDLSKYTFYRNEQEISLTKREIECLYYLSIGKTAYEISLILSISKRTVETHVQNIKNKLAIYKQCQLASIVAEYGLQYLVN